MMEQITMSTKNNMPNNFGSVKKDDDKYNVNLRNSNEHSKSDIFNSFFENFNNIFTFIKDTKENKNDLEDEVDEDLIKTLYNLCQNFINYIKQINDFGNMHLSNKEQEAIIESYEKLVRQCKQYNDKPQVKQLENDISNLLDLLFNNTAEAVNTLFSADSFFSTHVENLKLKLTERNQKIEFEQERLKKLELEAKVEEYDGIFEKNKEKNNEMDVTITKLKNDINKITEKIEKYDTYMKKKRKEIDINFSDDLDCKERIKLLEENIKALERNIKTTQLSPLKIVQRTDNFIILEFKTIRRTTQFRVNNIQSDNVHVEINPSDKNLLSYINGNIKKCKDISEITYLIKEAIYLNALDI
ncbi:conserved Plasmodium protein, unknown function [Plasmodium vinckei brucechwatti]|uniref:Uncharacterized protein n=1 Tax=Plasmodium vinckei brucechwatti TaxID=119398 RepID=A0A6V7SLI8_PLAVN|nr:conserved Plasmodium protein, unknown function [Plasmodium vinckei brucechwatti]